LGVSSIIDLIASTSKDALASCFLSSFFSLLAFSRVSRSFDRASNFAPDPQVLVVQAVQGRLTGSIILRIDGTPDQHLTPDTKKKKKSEKLIDDVKDV
jgi:hypothetical protein